MAHDWVNDGHQQELFSNSETQTLCPAGYSWFEFCPHYISCYVPIIILQKTRCVTDLKKVLNRLKPLSLLLEVHNLGWLLCDGQDFTVSLTLPINFIHSWSYGIHHMTSICIIRMEANVQRKSYKAKGNRSDIYCKSNPDTRGAGVSQCRHLKHQKDLRTCHHVTHIM